MRVIGNILWMIFAGFWLAIGYLLTGILFCITIIGIPYGLQCFKLAKFIVAPFGKKVDTNFDKHPIANIIWAILFGWEGALGALFTGLILCITIIGIPVGLKFFQIAKLLFIPFGSEIVEIAD